MLTRENQLATPDKIVSDNLTHKPSVTQSVFNNLSAGFATPSYAIESFDQEFNTSPRGKSTAAMFEALKRGNENAEVGWAQWGANAVSNMIGQILNPIGFALGEAGGVAVKPVSSLVGAAIAETSILRKPLADIMGESAKKYLPQTYGAEEKTLSAALFGEEMAKNFGIGAGFTLPQAIVDNFNAELGTHDLLGMAKEIGAGGVLGMGIGTIPFAWGVLKHNIFKRTGIDVTPEIPEEPEAPPGGEGGNIPPPAEVITAAPEVPAPTSQDVRHAKIDADLQQAVKDGRLDVESYNLWKDMQDYKTNPDIRLESRPEMKTKATQYLAQAGHEVDHANDMALFEVLDKEDIDKLQAGTVDQLVSDNVPEDQRTALTDFVVQNAVDEMRNQPGKMAGVQGYIEHADEALAKKDAIIEAMDNLIDVSVKLNEGVESIPLDQKSLYEMALNHGLDNDLPFYIPENIRNLIKMNDRDFLKYLKQEAEAKGFQRLNVNDDLSGHDFYHGTGAITDIKNFDITKSDETSLFGSGLYLTDNKLIAMGYAGSRQRSISTAHQGKILELKFKDKPKLIDLEAKPDEAVLNIINEEMAKHTTTHLSPENSEKPIEKIFQDFKHDLAEELHEGADAFSIYYNTINNINNALEKAGYDGYLHTGGLRVGKGKKHNVVIVFGHDYVSDGVHHIKSPAAKLNQETVDLAGDFKSKISKFRKVELSEIDKGRLSRLESENDELLAKFKETGSAKYIREVRINKDKINYIKSKVEKIKSPIDELNDIKNTLLEDRSHATFEVSEDTREKNQNEIAKLTNENDKLFQKYSETGEHEYVEEMQANHKKISELEGTRKVVRKDYATTKAFQRLQDLAEVWNPAKVLLDRIKLEEDINKQAAYRDLAKQMLDIAENNEGAKADINKVKDYMEVRNTQRVDEVKAEPMKEVNEAHKVPGDDETMIAEADQRLEDINQKHSREEYDTAKEKYQEFKKSQNIFKSMVNCILGASA